MTIQDVKRDLQDVRYYYSRRSVFDEELFACKKNTVVEKAYRYGWAMQSAPPRLYELYISLYVENKTQAAVAQEWNVCDGHIKNLNRQLREFLLAALNDKGGEL